MTTIVNSTAPAQAPEEKSSGSGFLIGIIVFIVFLAVVLYFGIPAINRMQSLEINVPSPQINVESPQIAVPDQVEVVPGD